MPTSRSLLAALAATVAVTAAYVALSTARSQINANPSWVAMGVAASGNSSTAWFHEPSTRQTVACRAVEGSGGTIASLHCVTGRLP
jgi:multidrug transporter EmrE-like cation transporter